LNLDITVKQKGGDRLNDAVPVQGDGFQRIRHAILAFVLVPLFGPQGMDFDFQALLDVVQGVFKFGNLIPVTLNKQVCGRRWAKMG